ncbi:MAG TPA: MBL fold metallo-hydrolase [Gemmatimonadales bacterium]|nr:MBL fold metallo-hydrolase [Gemmatimonadales bacterium]
MQLATGVFAAIRQEPLSLAVNSNSLIVVRDRDVVVVDAQFTRAATQETIAAIRKITDKPVGYVINTHWHDDHVAGNQVYQDSFPSVRLVMQENTAADLPTLGADNRKQQVEGAPPAADRFERLLSMGLGVDSTPATPQERTAVTSAIAIVRQYLKEAPGFRLIAATDTVRGRMTLGQGRDRIDLLWFGHGNTRGDLVVHLPERGIVATGDLVVAPIPFGFNSHPASWVSVLDSLMALKPRVIVPGHGPVMRDPRYVQSVRDWLSRISRETSAAVARGDSLGAALKAVTLDDVRLQVTKDGKWMNFLFRQFFVRPAVSAAFKEAGTISRYARNDR